MKNAIGTLLIILFCAVSARAQNIVVNEDPVITKMMAVFIGKGANIPVPGVNAPSSGGNTNAGGAPQIIDGFRIQILASTDRRQIEAGQSAFAARYPATFVIWQQAKPYYRLRVGA